MSSQERQCHFLQKRAIAEKEMETGCDCPGGKECPNTTKPCAGFVRNCHCDHDLSFLPWRKKDNAVDCE